MLDLDAEIVTFEKDNSGYTFDFYSDVGNVSSKTKTISSYGRITQFCELETDCESIHKSCLRGTGMGISDCTACYAWENLVGGECHPVCHSSCATCSGLYYNTCLTCHDGFYLEAATNICRACNTNCLTCDGPNLN